ncbi:MAG: heavy metal translocating P-type ATPase metal-binding domain-containing protein [Spirochaetes bacterium]|nr:heavy metal translocating P-type ATPase metal-binding domain-containing protein [Spirochaetota bacterium]
MRAELLSTRVVEKKTCAHCGAAGSAIVTGGLSFCCEGCSRVYSILRDQNLLGYYDFSESRPASLKESARQDFTYADGEWFHRTFTTAAGAGRYAIRLKLPAIHCAACVWLLEKMPEMLPGVTGARINYLRKELTLTAENSLPVSRLVQFVADLGYVPDFKPESGRSRALTQYDKGLLKRMAVAAFGFGNAMLFSFPEYFSERLEGRFQLTFMALNVALAAFILFYAAGEFFVNAWRALRQKKIILDLPISVGIMAMFARSVAEILQGTSSGYFDTFAGLIFFLLIGRYVQSRSYTYLAFERDNLLFLPLAVRKKTGENEKVTAVQDLQVGDTIRLLNGEIAPTRCRVISAAGAADYSFITGEALPVQLRAGDTFETGGRVVGQSVEMEITEPVDQARINRIWEGAGQSVTSTTFATESSFADRMLPYFTFVVIAAALAGLFYWLPSDSAKAWNAFSAVLVITCPCALAMAKPFSFYTTQSVLGRAGLYLKSAAVVEKFFSIGRIIFDKTGTITAAGEYEVAFSGAALTSGERSALRALTRESAHPLSRAVFDSLGDAADEAVAGFEEITGRGIAGVVHNVRYLLGSADFLSQAGVAVPAAAAPNAGSVVHAAAGARYLGSFSISNKSRAGLGAALQKLSADYRLALVSGDSDRERSRFAAVFPEGAPLHFSASPAQKAELVGQFEEQGPTLMLGDGLNDAAALGRASLGIAISENSANFSPASDAILNSGSFALLPRLLKQARQAKKTAIIAYLISFGYNIFGVSVALTGGLTPLFCAILMPISSLSVIAFTFFMARGSARLRGLN